MRKNHDDPGARRESTETAGRDERWQPDEMRAEERKRTVERRRIEAHGCGMKRRAERRRRGKVTKRRERRPKPVQAVDKAGEVRTGCENDGAGSSRALRNGREKREDQRRRSRPRRGRSAGCRVAPTRMDG